MPIYEYECTSCGKITEVMQRMADEPVCECPSCKGKVRKLISMNTFHLKGSGWYTTDYAGKNASVGSKVPEKTTPDPAPKVEKKTETKAAE